MYTDERGNGMEDKEIVSLYFARNDKAIAETSIKYKAYCMTVAVNILENSQDAEECVNDAFHKVWNSIPPASPENFRTYIGKIVRNLSFDRFRKSTSKKRGSGKTAVVLDELSEIVSGENSSETEMPSRDRGGGGSAGGGDSASIAYNLSYLTELQNRISGAMTKGELPFVESENKIEVVVNTNDEAQLVKVLQLDETGGAIIFVYVEE